MVTYTINTPAFDMIDITNQVHEAVRESGVEEGCALVYCPHTTAAITINENADPDVVRDLKLAWGDIFGDRRDFRHAEGNSAAHLKSSAIGASELVPISSYALALGAWQGIYFCEFDGPRTRRFHVQVMSA